MPCPSQMIEDKEEGSQVNSARHWLLTPALLDHFPMLPMENKANGCLSPWWPAVQEAYITSQCNVI